MRRRAHRGGKSTALPRGKRGKWALPSPATAEGEKEAVFLERGNPRGFLRAEDPLRWCSAG